MPSLKRSRSPAGDSTPRKRRHAEVDDDSDDALDISSALTGTKRRTSGPNPAASDDDDDDEALKELIRKTTAKRNVRSGTEVLKKSKGPKARMAKGEVGGGSFQSMGLHPSLLRSLTLQGYRVPTPIQRLSIPPLLSNPPRDLVGMARTGSGKSLAYMIPLVQRLGGRHSTTFGARALILLPTRELALQLLKVGKALVRGWQSGQGDHAGDKQAGEDGKRGQALRWALVVGGEGLDEQFEMITNNPDVIVATPGRLLHLIVEMNMDLKSVQYVVFDEADRLFELGFETALTEILHRLPATRQTLLFSATLPKSLVEFAKAGLSDPKLVRLDAESKISQDLKMAFFAVTQAEKEACLLALLREVIQVPLGIPALEEQDEGTTTQTQTLVFAATKHHVEHLQTLLTAAGYAVSHVYGALDQTARGTQMDAFRRGRTRILVVTDVAARGLDIPVLAHVVNYDFPHGARVFVHRVGRTARAGRPGWAWSLVARPELPDLLDLQLFLGRPLVNRARAPHVYTDSLVFGTFAREQIDDEVEALHALDGEHNVLPTLRAVMRKGQAMYERSRGKASQASYRRAKEMTHAGGAWATAAAHPVLGEQQGDADAERAALMSKVVSFTPGETVFEIGTRGTTENALLMKQRRKALSKAAQRAVVASTASTAAQDEASEDDGEGEEHIEVEMANEGDIEATFGSSSTKRKRNPDNFRDADFYMSHYRKDAATDKGYSLTDGASFVEQASRATFDLTGDDGTAARTRAASRQLTWDKRKKKFVRGGGEGADNVKLVRTEGGQRLPATYRSGRFDEWKARARVSMPRVGEAEAAGGPRTHRTGAAGGRRFRHQKVTDAKPLDKLANDYERKSRQVRKRGEESEGAARKPGGRPIGHVKSELKNVEQIRKSRKVYEQKRAKNARPTRGGKGGGGKRGKGRSRR